MTKKIWIIGIIATCTIIPMEQSPLLQALTNAPDGNPAQMQEYSDIILKVMSINNSPSMREQIEKHLQSIATVFIDQLNVNLNKDQKNFIIDLLQKTNRMLSALARSLSAPQQTDEMKRELATIERELRILTEPLQAATTILQASDLDEKHAMNVLTATTKALDSMLAIFKPVP